MSDPIDNLRRHVDASTALGSDRTAVLVADLRIALNRLAAAEARASGAEAEVERVRDEAVQSDRNAVATYIRAAAARMEHEPTILLCDLADDIEGGNHADAVSPSVALTSPAPPAGVAIDALGYPVATCPECGAKAIHYAFTMLVGTPDPNTYRCAAGHFFTPAPGTPGAIVDVEPTAASDGGE